MKSKTNKDDDTCLVSQKSLVIQDDLGNKPRKANKEDQTRPLHELPDLSHPCKTDKTSDTLIMSHRNQENVPKLQCPNGKEKLLSHENQLRSAFQFVRVQKERQNLPDDKRLHKRARNIRKNKAFKAKLLGRKCKEDKPSIPGLVIDAVVKKNIDYNLAQLSDTEVKCIQYGNTSYTSYNTDHPDWAAGYYSLLAYQTGIYRSKYIKIKQV